MNDRNSTIEYLKYLRDRAVIAGSTITEQSDWIVRLCDEVLEMLKEQEPRVLTIEEVLACMPSKEWLWFEENAYGYTEESAMICAQFYSLCDSWCAVDIPSAAHDETIEFDYEDYGKVWRCWSAKPSDEQREATPWTE